MQVLFDYGLTQPGSLKGITITSRGKKSRGKRYYAKDSLAFTAWKLLGYSTDDKDYQRWLKRLQDKKESKYNQEMS